MRMSWTLISALAVAGCAAIPGPSSVRNGDTQADVRAKLGAPGAERTLGGGALAWYYLTGPAGFETWRVVFDGSGRVSEYLQVLTLANFEELRSGGTRDETLDRLGPPMQRMSFARTATDAWTYRWLYGTLQMISEPVFDDRSGDVKYVGIYRDPAYASPPSGSMR